MSFLGLGFEFGARDVGQKAAFSEAEDSLRRMGDLLDKQNEKGSKTGEIWGKMKSAVRDFNIGSISSNVRKLTGETGNLTNGLESMAFQAQVAAKPILAQMDLTAEEHRKMMGKVTGMSVGMNVSADSIAETLKSIHTASKDARAGIDAMGMSEKDWVKVTQTTGISMDEYQAVLGNMISSWGASPDSAAKMVDSTLAIGKAAGVGSSGLKTMYSRMNNIDKIFEGLPPSMSRSGDEIRGLMESSVALSGAFREMGETQEQAMSLADATSSMFAEQSVALEKLVLGHGDLNDSPLFQWLTRLGVTSQDAMEIIKTGSRDAVKGTKMIQDAVAMGISRGTVSADSALTGLNSALGSSAGGLAYLVTNLDKGSAALDKMSSLVVNGEGALKKYGKEAFSTGRTLQEQLNFAQEQFETGLRRITRADVVKDVRAQQKAYKELGKQLKDTADEGGLMGGVIKMASKFDQEGPQGMFMDMARGIGFSRDEAAKFAVTTKTSIDLLGKAGDALSPVTDLMQKFGVGGMLAGGVSAFFMMSASQQDGVIGMISGLWDKAVDKFESVVVPGIKRNWPVIANGVMEVWRYFKEEIPWNTIGEEVIWPALKEIGTFVWDGLKWAWDKLGKELGLGGQLAVGAAIVGSVSPGLLGLAGQFATSILGGLGNGIGGVASTFGNLAMAGLRTSPGMVLAAGSIGAAIGSAISYYWENSTSDEWGLIQNARSESSASSIAASGTPDAKLNKRAELTKQLNDLYGEMGSVSGTDVGDFFTKTLLGEDTSFEKGIKNLENEIRILDESLNSDMGNMSRLTADLGSGDKTAMDAAMFEAESAFGMGSTPAQGGMSVMTDWAAGASSPEAIDALTAGIDKAMDVAKAHLGGSLPELGPLGGGEGKNAAYNGAVSIMEEFAKGIDDSTGLVSKAVSDVLDESVVKTLNAYEAKVEALGKQKDLLKGVAKSIMKNFGSDITSAEFEGERIDVEKRIESMINIPGMIGVTAAIIKTGADTQVILKKIYQETKRAADGIGGMGGGPQYGPIVEQSLR